MESSSARFWDKGKAKADGREDTPCAIGIDLGTTYSSVGVWQHSRVEIIANNLGNRTTPSCVAFTKNQRHLGDAAKNQAAVNPTNTIFDVKRLIGRKFKDKEVQDDMKLWPFKVVPEFGLFGICCYGKPMISVKYKNKVKRLYPEEISSMILAKMKDIAEAYLGREVKDSVVTVPAYFNNAQRQATKDAGVIAGLNLVRIINEPTAAAIAYGLDKKLTNNVLAKNILVFDLGGGTFDVSLVAVGKDGFQVKAVSGDTHLGGGDFDKRMVNHFVSEFKRKHNKDISNNPRAIGRLRGACERAKRNLSAVIETPIEIDCLFEGIDFTSTISRARFDKLNLDLFDKCLELVEKCLNDAMMGKNDVDEVVLVGGSTRILKVQQLLQDFFEGKELCKNINPDEAVTYGAAAHAATLSGVCVAHQNDHVLVDVIPLSLGIEVRDRAMGVIVPRNTTIPTKIVRRIKTESDYPSFAPFRVYEGERAVVKHNNFLGEFRLLGKPAQPKGVTKYYVCFDIDADGIITFSAEDLATKNRKEITITSHQARLSKKEINRMLKQAEKYKAHDKEWKKVVIAKNALDKCIEEKTDILTAYAHKMVDDDRKVVADAIRLAARCFDWNHLKSDQSGMIDKKMRDLEITCESVFNNLQIGAYPPTGHHQVESSGLSDVD